MFKLRSCLNPLITSSMTVVGYKDLENSARNLDEMTMKMGVMAKKKDHICRMHL